MIVNRLNHAASALAALAAVTLTLVVSMPTAFAYPAPDGPDVHGSIPAVPASASNGSPAWVFLIVVAATAVVAVMATLTFVRLTGYRRAAGRTGSVRRIVGVLPTS